MNPNQLERQEAKRIIKDYWPEALASRGINFAALSRMKIKDVLKLTKEAQK